MDPFCRLCFVFVFVMLFCLFLAALRSPDFLDLLCVMFFLCFVTLPYDVLGQVWYLIVSIPDFCLLPYFVINFVYSYCKRYGNKKRFYSLSAKPTYTCCKTCPNKRIQDQTSP